MLLLEPNSEPSQPPSTVPQRSCCGDNGGSTSCAGANGYANTANANATNATTTTSPSAVCSTTAICSTTAVCSTATAVRSTATNKWTVRPNDRAASSATI